MSNYNYIPISELGKNSNIRLEACETEHDIYWKIAMEVFDLIKENNRIGKATIMIVPYGPVGPYNRLLYLVNKHRLSLKQCYFINMDEYLDDNKKYLDIRHPLSFRGGMERVFYSKIDDELNLPIENRVFPEPGKEQYIWELIQRYGGLDMCFGGVGINGHIAFNEPPEPGIIISNSEFKNLPTRILELSRETRTINAFMNCKGDLDGIPRYCITVGMKEIWSSKKIRMLMPRDWNAGALRKILHGPVTCSVPCSLFQEHSNAMIYASAAALEPPLPEIRVYNKVD